MAAEVGAQYFTMFVENTSMQIRPPTDLHEFLGSSQYDVGSPGLTVNAALTVAALTVMSYMAYRMWSAGWKLQNTLLWQLCAKAAHSCMYLKEQTLYYLRRDAAQTATDVVIDGTSIPRMAVVVHMGDANNPDDVKSDNTPEPDVVIAAPTALDHVRVWLGEFRSDWVAMVQQDINPRSFLTRLLQFSDVLRTLQAAVPGGYDSPVLLYNLEDVRKGGRLPIMSIKVHDWGMNVVNAAVKQAKTKKGEVLYMALVGLVEAMSKLLDADHMVDEAQYARVPPQLQYEFHPWHRALDRDQQRVRFWKWASIMAHFMVMVPQLVLNKEAAVVTTVPLQAIRGMPAGGALTERQVTDHLSRVASPAVVKAVVQNIQQNGGRFGGVVFS